jgi:hypothetical protein
MQQQTPSAVNYAGVSENQSGGGVAGSQGSNIVSYNQQQQQPSIPQSNLGMSGQSQQPPSGPYHVRRLRI